MPLMSGFSLILRSMGSIVSMKIKGDKEHPCLVPLDTEKALDNPPFTRTLAVGEE